VVTSTLLDLPATVAETGPATTGRAAGARTSRPLLTGARCSKGHINDPRLAYCATCGISLLLAPRTPVPGPRPPLGVLVLDDGVTCPLVNDLVLGRTPEADLAVATGEADPIRLTGAGVSRVHARLVLEGWEVAVADAGSTNGTFIWDPAQRSWSRLALGARAVLRPGAALALGGRQLRYHTYRDSYRDR
jgi:hypothetical protein